MIYDIREFTDEDKKYKGYVIDLLDEDHTCTAVGRNGKTNGVYKNLLDVVIQFEMKNPVCKKCQKEKRRQIINKEGVQQDNPRFSTLKNGQEIRLTTIRQKYQCDCGSIFETRLPKRLQKVLQAKESAVKAIEEGTDLQMKAPEVGVGFSKATGSEVENHLLGEGWEVFAGNKETSDEYVKKVVEVMKQVVSYRDCSTLFFIPFLFRGEERCLMCGLSDSTPYLLDILDSPSNDIIEPYIDKRIKNKGIVSRVYCHVDDDVVATMGRYFPKAKTQIVYSRKCMQDYVKAYFKNVIENDSAIKNIIQNDPKLMPKLFYQTQMMNLIKKEDEQSYLCRFDKWWEKLIKEAKNATGAVYDFFYMSPDQITRRSFRRSYDSSAFSSLLGLIKELSNCTFVLMKSRLLLNRDMAESGVGTVKYMMDPMAMPDYGQFGVKIEDLLLEQEQYHQMVAGIAGIEFQQTNWREELKAISEAGRE